MDIREYNEDNLPEELYARTEQTHTKEPTEFTEKALKQGAEGEEFIEGVERWCREEPQDLLNIDYTSFFSPILIFMRSKNRALCRTISGMRR